jgi:hypothetical protein
MLSRLWLRTQALSCLPRQQLQHIYTPQSINEELARLTKDPGLTSDQQQRVRPLLEEHHNEIQALLDKHPNATRQELDAQIHAISDKTHEAIHALLNEHQQELEKAMRQREHKGEEPSVVSLYLGPL